MAEVPEQVLVEILYPRAKIGGKADIISTFKTLVATTNDAAASSNLPPSLGLKVFDNVNTHPEEAGLFLFWESMEHHDSLSQTPGFAAAAELFGEKIVPGLETPLDPWYMWTRQGEVALRDAACCEVIEVHTSGIKDFDGFSKKLGSAFDNLSLGGDFVGYFYGPRYDNATKFVIVSKWSSQAVISDNEWTQKIEKSLLDCFGESSSISKRQQMYA